MGRLSIQPCNFGGRHYAKVIAEIPFASWAMTALELLAVQAADPNDKRIDAEHEAVDGIAVPGDVEPELARRFVIGQMILLSMLGPFGGIPRANGKDADVRLACVVCGVVLDPDEPEGRLHIVPLLVGGALHLRECAACCKTQDPIDVAVRVRALVREHRMVLPVVGGEKLCTAVPVRWPGKSPTTWALGVC